MADKPSSENNAPDTVYDLIIIGGGPAGLSAAIYAARSKLNTLVIDKNPSAGALGSAHKIENYPGIPGAIPGIELLAIFRRQAESFGAKIIKGLVAGVNLESDPKEVYTNEETFRTRTVILATGSMGRKPSIPGEEKFRGRGVSYCATCDAAFFKNQDVAMAGELSEIIDEIDLIARFAARVYVITRSKSLSREEEDIFKPHRNIEVKPGCSVKEITGTEHVEELTVTGPSGTEEKVTAQGIFIYLRGNQPIVDFLYDSVKMNEGCILLNERDMSTSIQGVFAVGDVTCRKIRQVITAASEGCIAALSAEQYLTKRERARSQWSVG